MTTVLVTPYTLLQLQTDLYALLGDFQQTRFSATMVTDGINFAIKTMARKMRCTRVEGVIPVIATPTGENFGMASLVSTVTPIYNFTDYLELIRLVWGGVGYTYGNGPYYEMTRTTIEWEAERNPYWRQAVGLPLRWGSWDGASIFVTPYNPVLMGTNDNFTLSYLQAPQLLVAASDTVDARVPISTQQYIKYGAASWLLSLDQSDTTSLQTAKTYLDTFNALLEG